MIVKTPTGFAAHFRPWKNKDIHTVLDDARNKDSNLLVAMLKVAADPQGVAESGPYNMPEGGPIDWDQVLSDDVTILCMTLRAMTKPEFPFFTNCRNCGKRNSPTVDIKDFDIILPSEEGLKVIESNSAALREINGYKIKLKPQRVPDSALAAKWQKQSPEKMIAVRTCLSIHSVLPPGEGQKENTRFKDIMNFYDEGGLDLQEKLDVMVWDLFGGVDVHIDYVCDKCNAEVVTYLPLDERLFGFDPDMMMAKPLEQFSDANCPRKVTLGEFLS